MPSKCCSLYGYWVCVQFLICSKFHLPARKTYKIKNWNVSKFRLNRKQTKKKQNFEVYLQILLPIQNQTLVIRFVTTKPKEKKKVNEIENKKMKETVTNLSFSPIDFPKPKEKKKKLVWDEMQWNNKIKKKYSSLIFFHYRTTET